MKLYLYQEEDLNTEYNHIYHFQVTPIFFDNIETMMNLTTSIFSWDIEENKKAGYWEIDVEENKFNILDAEGQHYLDIIPNSNILQATKLINSENPSFSPDFNNATEIPADSIDVDNKEINNEYKYISEIYAKIPAYPRYLKEFSDFLNNSIIHNKNIYINIDLIGEISKELEKDIEYVRLVSKENIGTMTVYYVPEIDILKTAKHKKFK